MFAVKLLLALAALWSVAGIVTLALLTPSRRGALPAWRFNLIGGPIFLALALRGWATAEGRLPARVFDVTLGCAVLALLTLVAFAR